MAGKVLVIGSVTADINIYVDHIPEKEEDVNVERQTVTAGGCAYNAASILHLSGVPYTLFASVGKGIYGDLILNLCRKSGIMPVLRSEKEHGCCYCLIAEDGSRTFLANHGCEYLFEQEALDTLNMEEYEMIYVCGLEIEEKTGERLISFLEKQKNKKIVYAPGARIRHIQRERNLAVMRLAGMVHMNRKEMNQFLASEKITYGSEREAADAMRKYTSGDLVITDGSRAVMIYEKDKLSRADVVPVSQVNSTGAGDSHVGMVMAALMMEYPLDQAVKAANLVSAASVMKDGMLTLEEFTEIMKQISRR